MANTLALDNAVKSAVTAANKEVGEGDAKAGDESKEDKAGAGADDTKVSDKTKTDEDDKPKATTLDEKQLAEATELYTKLLDPKQGPVIIDWFARQAGYTRAEVKEITEDGTKKETKELKNDILDALKEKLGPELDFLSDKLAPAIESILESRMTKATEDIRESIQKQELEKLEKTSADHYSILSKEYFNTDAPSDAFDKVINELVDEMPPSKGLSLDKYMRNLFDIAMSRMGLQKFNATKNANTERANKNRTDAASRLASNRGANGRQSPLDPLEASNTRMSLVDAVKKAVDQVNERTKD